MIPQKEQNLSQVLKQNSGDSMMNQILKIEEKTAEKVKGIVLTQNQKIRIRNQLFSLFKHESLRGKIKVQDLHNLSEIEITFYHKIKNRIQNTLIKNVQENVRIIFSEKYPEEPPKLEIHSCNLTQQHPEYIVPNFLTLNEFLTSQKWTPDVNLGDVLAKVMETIEDFHVSEIQRLIAVRQEAEEEVDSCQSLINQGMRNREIHDQPIRNRRKSSNMTGCADKELTQTKNLNRHFRSKLRQVLRDLVSSPEYQFENFTFVDQIFTPNRVGFEDIRKALSNKWFNNGVRRQMNSGQFLHKILRGMMGIKSKKLMIKYYHVMVSAVQEPTSFTRWKYQ